MSVGRDCAHAGVWSERAAVLQRLVRRMEAEEKRVRLSGSRKVCGSIVAIWESRVGWSSSKPSRAVGDGDGASGLRW